MNRREASTGSMSRAQVLNKNTEDDSRVENHTTSLLVLMKSLFVAEFLQPMIHFLGAHL